MPYTFCITAFYLINAKKLLWTRTYHILYREERGYKKTIMVLILLCLKSPAIRREMQRETFLQDWYWGVSCRDSQCFYTTYLKEFQTNNIHMTRSLKLTINIKIYQYFLQNIPIHRRHVNLLTLSTYIISQKVTWLSYVPRNYFCIFEFCIFLYKCI